MNRKMIFSLSAALLFLMGCDYNDKYFDGLEGSDTPTDVKKLEYTLTVADYATISENSTNINTAEAAGLKNQLAALKTNRYFTNELTAAVYVPAFLAEKWYTADAGSAVKLTYDESVDAPEYIAGLATVETYTVTDANYVGIWGEVDAKYFTPSKPLTKSANKILSAAYPGAQEGDTKVVAYKYSITEPNVGGEEVIAKELDESFDHISVAGGKTAIDGWLNIAEEGTRFWTDKYYNGGYTECTANKAESNIVAWLVSPKVDLSSAIAPKLAFDVCLGYPNGAVLQVLVSDDFNGSDVASATWTDLTAYFAFDASNEKFGKMSPAGIYDMSAYKENPIYIAYKYVGDANKTTTFQIDNIQLGDNVSVEATSVYKEDFENGTDAWEEQIIQGDFKWTPKDYGDNHYVQFSANKSTEEQESYYISPEIVVPAVTQGVAELLFDVCVGYWNANCLSVLVSTDYNNDINTATWKDMTAEFGLPEAPTNGYGKLGYAGAAPLNEFAGQTIRVAFRYVGNGTDARSTTYQIDNIEVQTVARKAAVANMLSSTRSLVGGVNELAAMYAYDGATWLPSENATVVSPSDYKEMGFTTFSSSNKPDNYLPQFLTAKYPYAQEEQKVGVVYTFSDTQEAAEYMYAAGVWTKNDNMETVTEQFVFSGGKWALDPSVVIELLPTKNDLTVLYMQTATDWVWEHIDQGKLNITNKGEGYVTSFGNNEYYSGCSAYYGNVDMRVAKAKDQYPDGYKEMSDDDILRLMEQHLIEVIAGTLAILDSDAVPGTDAEVFYTVKVGIFTGTNISTCTHQMVYKVTEKGKFEYVEDSFQAL